MCLSVSPFCPAYDTFFCVNFFHQVTHASLEHSCVVLSFVYLFGIITVSGQFGPLSFSSGAFVGCLLATILSILDSVGDYFACARACYVPPPPSHAVNRGLTIEGICTFLAGAVGCGHATTTYAGNIGAMGLTKVGTQFIQDVIM